MKVGTGRSSGRLSTPVAQRGVRRGRIFAGPLRAAVLAAILLAACGGQAAAPPPLVGRPGSSPTLTPTFIAPSGGKIAFVSYRNGMGEIFAVYAGGTGLVNLSHRSAPTNGDPPRP